MRIFAFDLDGTLLSKNGIILESSKKVIKHLKECQDALVIASGRTFEEIMEIVSELHLDQYPNAYLIGYNGVELKHYPSMTSLYRSTISWNEVKLIWADVQKHQLALHVFEEKKLYLSHGMTRFLQVAEEAKAKNQFVDFSAFETNQPIYKALIIDEPSRLDDYQQRVDPLILKRVSAFKSAPMIFEFVSLQGTKGRSLQELARILHVSQEEVYAFGDEENDISMIEFAGYGIAMGNAKALVKQKARYITKSHQEDGIYEMLKQLQIIQ